MLKTNQPINQLYIFPERVSFLMITLFQSRRNRLWARIRWGLQCLT